MCLKLPILAVLCLAVAGAMPTRAHGQIGASIPPKSSVAGASAASSAAPAATEIAGDALLEKAIVAMDARPSISAKTSHQVSLFAHSQVLGTGRYLEQQSPRGRLFRLDLRLTLGGQRTSTLVEVFDGRYLWRYEDGENKRLTKVDLDKVNRALRERKQLADSDSISLRPGLGGLSKLLRGLHGAFTFTTVQQTGFLAGDGSTDHELPAWKLEGSWRQEKLLKLLPEQMDDIKAGKPPRLSELPHHLPDRVILYLGKEDLFPYQIDYRRTVPPGLLGGESTRSRSLLTMRFTEVDFGCRIDESEFHYSPGKDTPQDLTPVDRTEAFLSSQALKHLLRSRLVKVGRDGPRR